MSDRAQRILLWALAIVLVGGTALALQFVRGYRPLAGFGGPAAGPSLPAGVSLRFDRVRVVGRSNEQPAWIVTADRVDSDREHTQVAFKGNVQATLLQSGRAHALLTSPDARFDTVRRVLNVTGSGGSGGGIVCRLQDPETGKTRLRIESPDVQWQVDGRLLHADGPVTAVAEGSGDTVRGEQVDVDLQTRDMSAKNVSGTIYVSGDEPPTELLKALTP